MGKPLDPNSQRECQIQCQTIECQNWCQKECQSICQKECKIECQIRTINYRIYVIIYICHICFQILCQKLCQTNVSGWGTLEVKYCVDFSRESKVSEITQPFASNLVPCLELQPVASALTRQTEPKKRWAPYRNLPWDKRAGTDQYSTSVQQINKIHGYNWLIQMLK
jgi:hypothetical protein